ncbi:MAG: ABC transporter substrate-binding protein [Reyranellaceae bacterium]
MRRRLLLAIAATLAGTAAAEAQAPAQPGQRPTIGYLTLRSPEGDRVLQDAFRRGLAEAGLVDGSTVTILVESADGRSDRLKGLAEGFVQRGVSVIFAGGSNTAVAARAATVTIPIVYTGASDPVHLGLVRSLAKPGGNVTGITMYAHTYSAKRLELLHELVPPARTIGVLVNPANPSAGQQRDDLSAAARTLGLDLRFVEARHASDLEAAFAALKAGGAQAVVLVDDPMFGSPESRVAERALAAGLPLISTLRELAERGGLASYGTDFALTYRDAARYVTRILRGERPADLPVMLPTAFVLTLNTGTARRLGLAIPPALLARADEVLP